MFEMHFSINEIQELKDENGKPYTVNLLFWIEYLISLC